MLLVEKYPDDALPALIAGARNATESRIREGLTQLAGDLKGGGPVDFLREQLKSGSTPEVRLAAAKALHKRGHGEAVTAMIEQWNRPVRENQSEYDRFRMNLASFLLESGKVEAIEPLNRTLPDLPVYVKRHIVSEVVGSNKLQDLFKHTNDPPQRDQVPTNDQKEVRAAILSLLLTALDSTEHVPTSGSWGGKRISNPRVCDIAGHVLHLLDENRYPFDLEGTMDDCEQARLMLKNDLRAERGLPALPIPPKRTIKPVPDEVIAPLLRQFVQDPAKSDPAIESRIVDLGLGALSAVVKAGDQFAADDPRRLRLDMLARRLAILVVEVRIAEKSEQLPAELAEKLERLRNLPFEAHTYSKLVPHLIEAVSREVPGVSLVVSRSKSVAGVTLRIDRFNATRAKAELGSVGSAPGPAAPIDKPYAWEYSYSLSLGGEYLLQSSGVGSMSGSHTDNAQFKKHLEKIAAATYDHPFEIRLQLLGAWRD
jgi:hypothetical protein